MSTLLLGGRPYTVNKQGPRANEGGESVACSKAPFTWYRVPETALPRPELHWPRQRLSYFFLKFNQPFTLGTRTRLGGETTRVGELSHLGR